MALRLIGAPTSWNTLRARHVLFEKGLHNVELVDLSVPNGDQKVNTGHLDFSFRKLYN
jgi:hypothetical protein